MSARRPWWSMVRARHAVQIAALVLFFAFFLLVRSRPNWMPDWTANFFFDLDPLIALLTGVATRAVPEGILLALAVVVITVLLGRVFCGWFCPLGTLHAISGRFLFYVWPAKKKTVERTSGWQRAKYVVLLGALLMAALGSNWLCIFDPIVLLTRSSATALFPGAHWAVEEGATAIWQADPHVGPLHLTSATEPVYAFLRDNVLGVPRLAFVGSGLIFGFFLLALLLNRVRRRFWCRYVCPLGALLGLLSWRPFLRRKLASAEACTECEMCNRVCSGAAANGPGTKWSPSECLGCMNCTAACPPKGLQFSWAVPWRKEPEVQPVDLSKRALFGAAVGGAVGICLLRITPQCRGTVYNPQLIRPPGALPEPEFLRRCTSCGLCMKVCTTGGLQPTLSEAGLEGLWTPRLMPKIGPCDYSCNLCGHVCPTGAIQPLSVEDKQDVRIGLATFDKTRCIPYAFGRDCSVCEEHCPLPSKAIYAVEVEVVDREGTRKTILQPRVDPAMCTGCGMCESVCPFRDRPAIRVTSANESRHEGKNQPILTDEWDAGIDGY